MAPLQAFQMRASSRTTSEVATLGITSWRRPAGSGVYVDVRPEWLSGTLSGGPRLPYLAAFMWAQSVAAAAGADPDVDRSEAAARAVTGFSPDILVASADSDAVDAMPAAAAACASGSAGLLRRECD